MTATMQTTEINGRQVILTNGMLTHDGTQLVGMFASEEDARSMDADRLALGTLDAANLTDEQLRIAARNSDEL